MKRGLAGWALKLHMPTQVLQILTQTCYESFSGTPSPESLFNSKNGSSLKKFIEHPFSYLQLKKVIDGNDEPFSTPLHMMVWTV